MEELLYDADDKKKNIVDNPDMLLDIKIAMLSAMAFWCMKDLNRISDEACWDLKNVDLITSVVNKGEVNQEGGKKRIEYFNNITTIMKK